MRSWLREHGLLVVNLALFVIFIGGMALSGVRVYNDEGMQHGGRPGSFAEDPTTGGFV